MSSTELQPSKLGTKEHWDGVYSSELTNFQEIGDEGEVWFGEDSAEKMVDWAVENVPTDPAPYVLEVGAGNGYLLFALCAAGYAPERTCGVDYSPDAVTLAQAIANTRAKSRASPPSDEEGGDERAIVFAVCDLLQDDVPPLPGMSSSEWDLVLDKGTFDAIALAEKSEDGVPPADRYPLRISRVVRPGGHFLITSCNFTEEELKVRFANEETGLKYHSKVSWPTFSFGGQSGNVYSTVAFCKPIGKSW